MFIIYINSLLFHIESTYVQITNINCCSSFELLFRILKIEFFIYKLFQSETFYSLTEITERNRNFKDNTRLVYSTRFVYSNKIDSYLAQRRSRQTLPCNIPVIVNNFSCVLYLFLYTYMYIKSVFSQRNNWIPPSCHISW